MFESKGLRVAELGHQLTSINFRLPEESSIVNAQRRGVQAAADWSGLVFCSGRWLGFEKMDLRE